jgi:hypothetical protein
MWGNIHPESGQAPGRLVHRFFSCTRGVLRGTYARRIEEDLVGPLTPVVVHVWPAVLPDVTSVPAANAVIDGIPVAKVVG